MLEILHIQPGVPNNAANPHTLNAVAPIFGVSGGTGAKIGAVLLAVQRFQLSFSSPQSHCHLSNGGSLGETWAAPDARRV